MYKSSLINFPTAIKNQKNIIDQQALNNLILHATKLHDSATKQQKLIDQVKSEHDKIATKLDEIEKNIESLNNMEVPDNIKEYCCKGIYISLEETSVEKKNLSDQYEAELEKLPKEQIGNISEIISETIQDLNKAVKTLEDLHNMIQQ
jgi:hypothetical protein